MACGEEERLGELGGAISAEAWDLALEVIAEALDDGLVPSLDRLGRLGQLGAMPALVAEIGAELTAPDAGRMRPGSPLATLVRDHAREREALGFAPREIVTELLLLRRVLWRFVVKGGNFRETADVLALERRLNDTVDRLVIECVVAYFDRATAELAERARLDPLTELLNHQAFTRELRTEIDRAARYDHGLALVFLDVDDFKAVNDTLGHPEGDAVLRRLARVLRESLRSSDLAGRMGGDEFAACLVESDQETAGRLVARLVDRIDELVSEGELPKGFSISPGVAHFPTEASDADALFRLADERLYVAKRGRG
jgi:diguanylate cyclase (GGDEF)-like protein